MPHLKAMLFMVVGMAAFALSDTLIKLLSVRLSVGQVIMLSGTGSALYFYAVILRRGEKLLDRKTFCTPVVVRTLGETIGSVGYITAIAISDLSVAASILQAQPLIVTLAAAIFLGERLRWRRMAAILTGFVGVLIIIRPSADGVEAASLLALLGALGLTARDLGSRALPPHVSTAAASLWPLILLVPVGAIMMQLSGGWIPMTGQDIALTLATVIAISVAFIAITEAMRRAPVAIVSPFRYMRMVFILTLAYLVFGEVPDLAMWIGLALIIGSGLYAFAREAQLSKSENGPAA